MARILVAQRDLHFGNLLARPGQVLMTPAHYRLLGARIVVLLHDISKLPLLPVCLRPETDTLGEATRLEVEYGLALIEYMLEVARRGFITTRYPWKAKLTRQQSCLWSFGGGYIEKQIIFCRRIWVKEKVIQECQDRAWLAIAGVCETQMIGADNCFSTT
jgi:hypothetical protein